MKREVLLRSMLFHEIAEADLDKLLHCLRAETRRYAKGGSICRAGERAAAMGLVLSGGVNIENDDIWGNRTILDHVAPGQVFAEAYACAPGEPLQVSATAAEETEVLFLQAGRLLKPCSQGCAQHSQLLRNLLVISAQKNLILSRRMFHTTSKTIRGRLQSYFSDQAVRQGSREFSIPFNRQQLADYLGVDRSAMSHELSKMQRDGLLTYERNQFRLAERICTAADPVNDAQGFGKNAVH